MKYVCHMYANLLYKLRLQQNSVLIQKFAGRRTSFWIDFSCNLRFLTMVCKRSSSEVLLCLHGSENEITHGFYSSQCVLQNCYKNTASIVGSTM